MTGVVYRKVLAEGVVADHTLSVCTAGFRRFCEINLVLQPETAFALKTGAAALEARAEASCPKNEVAWGVRSCCRCITSKLTALLTRK